MMIQKKSKKCAHCEADFWPRNSLQKYCSYTCMLAENNGEQQTKIKKSTSISKVSARQLKDQEVLHKNYDELKADIIKKHGRLICEHCGEEHMSYDPHHIIWRSEKPKHPRLHDKINLLNVGRDSRKNCHGWYHVDKGRRNKLVIERWLDLIFGPDVLNK